MEDFSLSVCVRADNEIRSMYTLTEKGICEQSNLDLEQFSESQLNDGQVLENCQRIDCHILLIKPFLELLDSSKWHRKMAVNHFRQKSDENARNYKLLMDTDILGSYAIDYAWGLRCWRDCHMTLERECATAWLSTLGGGFSALGDYSSKFAARALQTSLQQLWLAKMCCDESGIARGLLFLALALSQLGLGSFAFCLLHKAWNHPTYDTRHRHMCLGVQAKLKYDSKVRRLSSKKIDKAAVWNSIKTISIL